MKRGLTSGLGLSLMAAALLTAMPMDAPRAPRKRPSPKSPFAPEGNRSENRAKRSLARAKKKHKLKGLR